jgi:hypothetical protein
MRGTAVRLSLFFVVLFCIGCGHGKNQPPSQAVAPPLQTGKGTLNQPDTTKPPEGSTPLSSPLPQTSAQNVPIPPPPPPRKAKHREKTKPKPADQAQTAQAAPPVTPPANVEPVAGASPIGQITTGDSATGERDKHETSDLIAETQQGLAAIKRPLSEDEKVTATQIRTFLNQAEQALQNGDTDGARTLATKAKLLLDELTKP